MMVSNQGDGDICWLRSCFGIGNIKADNNCGISRYREEKMNLLNGRRYRLYK